MGYVKNYWIKRLNNMFKDTKEGETHSYNDGCGEPAHNPKLPQHIEESFDTLFNSLGYDLVDTHTCGFMEECRCINGRDKLKSFIATILEEVTKEAWVQGFLWTGEGFNGEYLHPDVRKGASIEVAVNRIYDNYYNDYLIKEDK